MNKETRLKVIERLRKLGNGEIAPDCPVNGLCFEIDLHFDILIDHYINFAEWPEFSGEESCPIPCPLGGDPIHEYRCSENMWIGEYGESRKRFCLWCADELEKQL